LSYARLRSSRTRVLVLACGIVSLLLAVLVVPLPSVIAHEAGPGPRPGPSLNPAMAILQSFGGSASARRLDAPLVSGGDLIGVNFPIAAYELEQLGGKVSYNSAGNRFLVYWDEARSGWHAQGQVVSSTGALVGPSVGLSPAGSNSECACPAAAASNVQDEYMLVWQDNRGGNCEILGQRVTGDGSLAGSSFAVASYSGEQKYPAIATNADSGEYLVVWQDNRTGSWDVLGQRVSSTGVVAGNIITASATALQEQYPAVAFNPVANQYLVVWEGNDAGTFRLQGLWLSVLGVGVGQAFTIASASTGQLRPAISCSMDSDECLVVWHRSGGGGSDIAAGLVSATGGLVGSVFDVAATPDIEFHTRASYSTGGREYLVVWYGGPGLDAFGQRVSEDGQLLGGLITVAAAANTQGSPSPAYNAATNEYLVVWDDGRDGAYDVWGQFVKSGFVAPQPTATATPSDTPSPSTTPTASPSMTSTPAPSATPLTTSTLTSTVSPSPTSTPNSTSTPFRVYLPIIFRSPPPTPTPTETLTPAPTWTPTETHTLTPTWTPTATWTPMATSTPTATPTMTATATNTPPPTATLAPTPNLWTKVFSDDFEGVFPGPWIVSGNGFGSGYTWGQRACRGSGRYSAWAVGGGSSGYWLSCNSYYPPGVDSRMVYGPFSLVGATAGQLVFDRFVSTAGAGGGDSLCWGASKDGSSYSASCDNYSYGWSRTTLDLNAWIGEPNVWIRFRFTSDGWQQYAEGAYVDNVLIRKCVIASCGGVSVSSPTNDSVGFSR
jgi:hypothetical protein